jgi:hypothetical protein
MSSFLTAISINQADFIKSMAIFYLLLIANYVGNSLFTCFQIKFISSHKMIQLMFAFFLFYFLVTLVSNTGNLQFTPPIEKFLYSTVYFVAFIILMRLNIVITSIVLIFIFILYFIELNKEFYLDKSKINNNAEVNQDNKHKYWVTLDYPFKIRLFPINSTHFLNISIIEKIIYYIIIVLVLFGFISYGGEIKDSLQYKKNITWFDIFMDTDICKIKTNKSFWNYFKTGLGIR